MKKITALLLVGAMLLALLCACSSTTEPKADDQTDAAPSTAQDTTDAADDTAQDTATDQVIDLVLWHNRAAPMAKRSIPLLKSSTALSAAKKESMSRPSVRMTALYLPLKRCFMRKIWTICLISQRFMLVTLNMQAL